MKTTHKTIASIVAAALTMIVGAANSLAVNRTLILLQENSSGTSYMTDVLPPGPLRDAADAIIDGFVENGETAKFQLLAAGHYQRFVNLSDNACTRANLLSQLIQQSNDGYTVDLAVLGHGSSESLHLHGNEFLTGQHPVTINTPNGPLQIVVPGNIRTLLTDARATQGASFNFKLRVVHMCNCFGSTLNDDWLNIGAKVSVGSLHNNFMPEPMITSFWNDFVTNDVQVCTAASNSFATASVLYSVVPGYTQTMILDSTQVVTGNRNLIFKDEFQLAVNQSRTFDVYANKAYNFPKVYLVAGQTYTFAASANDHWTNLFGGIVTNANGNDPVLIDPPLSTRRFPANMMRLIGERFRHTNDPLAFISGSGFSIGTSRTFTPGIAGFLNLYANDLILAYGDNGGKISVTVTRTQ